ncbi:MAG: hypothetical protein U5K51_03325 [Flavobacteriaceae bacterium]|nr:hypothetical protein [Flavobacteriaceae bacterium]
MYLEADLDAKVISGAMEIPRKLLVNNENIYVVNDTVLELVPVNIVHFNNQSAVVKGLADGSKILSKPVPGAFEGMVVKTLETDTKIRL